MAGSGMAWRRLEADSLHCGSLSNFLPGPSEQLQVRRSATGDAQYPFEKPLQNPFGPPVNLALVHVGVGNGSDLQDLRTGQLLKLEKSVRLSQVQPDVSISIRGKSRTDRSQ
jgi:hypothetical protein